MMNTLFLKVGIVQKKKASEQNCGQFSSPKITLAKDTKADGVLKALAAITIAIIAARSSKCCVLLLLVCSYFV